MVMATIYTIVGEYEKAIDEFVVVLAVPSWASASYLRVDPLYAPLQEMPRFITLLRKYDKENNR